MPWEKSFDTEAALEKAMQVFWAKGYSATSMADLTGAMQINKGSLYNAYGSKEKLFIAAVAKYDLEHRRQMLAKLDAIDDPVEAVSTLFDTFLKQSVTDDLLKGCLLVNTALELASHGEAVRDMVTMALNDFEAFFRRLVARAQTRGQIPADIKPDETAKGLLTLVVGLRVLARGATPADSLFSIKSQAIRLLGAV